MMQEETVERKERKQDGSKWPILFLFIQCLCMHDHTIMFEKLHTMERLQGEPFLPMKKMFFHFAFLGLQTFAAVFSVASGCEPLCSGLKVPLKRCLEGHLKAAFDGVGLKEGLG